MYPKAQNTSDIRGLWSNEKFGWDEYLATIAWFALPRAQYFKALFYGQTPLSCFWLPWSPTLFSKRSTFSLGRFL